MKAFMFCGFLLLVAQVISINAQEPEPEPECLTNEDCMTNGQCIENVCQCADGFVEVQKLMRKVCLPYATLENEFACRSDEQCSLIQDETNPDGSPATCTLLGRTCGCKDSSWYPFQTDQDEVPFCVRGFGSTCDKNEQCQRSITGGVCAENKCACPEDYLTLEDEHMCLPYATDENNHCTVNEQCGLMHDKFAPAIFHRHPKCDKESESCVCHLPNFEIQDSNCVRVEKPECETNEDCMENGQCVENACQCTEGFVEVHQMLQKLCLPYATLENEFACRSDEQCSLIQDETNPDGTPATCTLLGRTCGCKDSTWYPFETDQDEVPFCVRGFGSTCESDEQCQRSIVDGVCEENKCACPADYLTLEDEHMCLAYATDEENHCIVDQQCANMYDKFSPNVFSRHPKCDVETESCVCHMENFAIFNSTCVRGAGAKCGVGLMRKCGVEHSKCSLLSQTCECIIPYFANEQNHLCEWFWSEEQEQVSDM